MSEEQEKEPVTMIITPVRCEYHFTPGTASQKFLRAIEKGKSFRWDGSFSDRP